MHIQEIESSSELMEGFRLMKDLRPELEPTVYLERFPELLQDGYRLAGLFEGGAVLGLAGFRIIEGGYGWERYLYLEELVVSSDERSKGNGAALMEWLRIEANKSKCFHIRLDSGVQRFRAHRFYLLHNFKISHHHFRLEVADDFAFTNKSCRSPGAPPPGSYFACSRYPVAPDSRGDLLRAARENPLANVRRLSPSGGSAISPGGSSRDRELAGRPELGDSHLETARLRR